jgi:hypothetical protein
MLFFIVLPNIIACIINEPNTTAQPHPPSLFSLTETPTAFNGLASSSSIILLKQGCVKFFLVPTSHYFAIIFGILFSCGLFYIEFQKEFEEEKGQIALLGTIAPGITHLIGQLFNITGLFWHINKR